MHHLIEKSATRKGEYVGYCKGAQRIRRTSYGWATYELGSSAGEFVAASGRTLTELGKELELRANIILAPPGTGKVFPANLFK